MARASITSVAKLVIVETLSEHECADLNDLVQRVVDELERLGVAALPENVAKVVKSVVSRNGRQLGACWAPGKSGRICRC